MTRLAELPPDVLAMLYVSSALLCVLAVLWLALLFDLVRTALRLRRERRRARRELAKRRCTDRGCGRLLRHAGGGAWFCLRGHCWRAVSHRPASDLRRDPSSDSRQTGERLLLAESHQAAERSRLQRRAEAARG